MEVDSDHKLIEFWFIIINKGDNDFQYAMNLIDIYDDFATIAIVENMCGIIIYEFFENRIRRIRRFTGFDRFLIE